MAVFYRLGILRAKCIFCNEVMSYAGGCPHNLLRHTKSIHPIQFAAIQDTEDQPLTVREETESPIFQSMPSEPSLLEKSNKEASIPSTSSSVLPVIPAATRKVLTNAKMTTFFYLDCQLARKQTKLIKL